MEKPEFYYDEFDDYLSQARVYVRSHKGCGLVDIDMAFSYLRLATSVIENFDRQYTEYRKFLEEKERKKR